MSVVIITGKWQAAWHLTLAQQDSPEDPILDLCSVPFFASLILSFDIKMANIYSELLVYGKRRLQNRNK